MKKHIIKMTALLLCLLFLAGCVTNTHTIGRGPDTGYTETRRQYYVLGGLLPLGEVDTNQMAGGDQNYRIVTGFSLMDFIISSLTGGILMSRTITVIK